MKLFNGDCLEILKDVPDNSVDLVIIDPPYEFDGGGGGGAFGTSSAVCYISRLPVNFNEFNSWSEPTEYDLSNASFTTLGTLILSNEIIEKWSSTSDNTKVIYFNKNCDL